MKIWIHWISLKWDDKGKRIWKNIHRSKEYNRKNLKKIFLIKIKNKYDFLFLYLRKKKRNEKLKKDKKRKKGNRLKIWKCDYTLVD